MSARRKRNEKKKIFIFMCRRCKRKMIFRESDARGASHMYVGMYSRLALIVNHTCAHTPKAGEFSKIFTLKFSGKKSSTPTPMESMMIAHGKFAALALENVLMKKPCASHSTCCVLTLL